MRLPVASALAIQQYLGLNGDGPSGAGVGMTDALKRVVTCDSFKTYTALGDSYSCGFGANTRLGLCKEGGPGFGTINCTTPQCGQDIGAYSYMFAQKYGVKDFRYLACNGNDTLSVRDSQVNGGSYGEPDLVTLSAGGDDESFFAHTVQACLQGTANDCDQAIQRARQIIDNDLPSRYPQMFGAIKDKVNASTKAVKVVSVGYAQFFGNRSTCAWPLSIPSPEQRSAMNDLAIDLNKRLATATIDAGFLYADVDSAFEGNRLCDSPDLKSWFQVVPRAGFDQAGEWYFEVSVMHPTQDGQDTMLRALETVLGC